MTDDVETRRRRAAYRASHRGTKEMDWVIGRFAEAELPVLEGSRLAAFEELLGLPDPLLHELIMEGRGSAAGQVGELIEAIRAFHGLNE